MRSLRPGHAKVVCDRTGFSVWDDETQMEWNGLRVKSTVWEPRHPQDFPYRGRDNQAVPNARPKRELVYLEVGDVTADDL